MSREVAIILGKLKSRWI